MVEAFPICWWFPPPWGWSTGFIATPRVRGQLKKNVGANREELHVYVPVALGLVLVECTAGLEQRFVDPPTSSDNADGSTSAAADSLLGTRGQADASLVVIDGVADDGGIVARCACECATIANLLLNVANDGTLRASRDREDVSDTEGGLLAAVDEGTGVHALGSNEGLGAQLVPVGVAEDNAGEGSTTTKNKIFGPTPSHPTYRPAS